MVGKGIKIVLLFSILFFFYVVGSLIFTKGFLLSRIVVDRNSSCHVDFAEYADDVAHGKPGCWLHRRFDKAIIIIIDALRFDFLTPIRDDSATNIPYLNKLPTVRNLIDSQPMNARLFKFLADPPTTTLQRLKGLTTGSLPTFVDAGSNFASTEITEDNFIDQLVKKGKKLTFMGDDTWISLFPGRFYHQFPFPSFNVKDLNTVDDGILANLYGEIRSNNWDIIIAHFLGVDHCGHTYGPNSPAMTSKLTQMDQMIRYCSLWNNIIVFGFTSLNYYNILL